MEMLDCYLYKNSDDSNGKAINKEEIKEKRLHRFNQLISVHLISPVQPKHLGYSYLEQSFNVWKLIVSTKITRL